MPMRSRETSGRRASTHRTAAATSAADRSRSRTNSCESASDVACSPRLRQTCHDLPVETDEPVELTLEQPLLIAVGAESFRTVFRVGRRADAEALDALRAQLRHVGGAGAHRGN